MIDLTQILVAVIAVLGTVLTTYLLPLLKAKINTAQYEQILQVVQVIVQAVEQLDGHEVIESKFNYAMELIEDELARHNLKFDYATIEMMIEAAVRQYFPKK